MDRHCEKNWKYLPTENFSLLQTEIVLTDNVSKRKVSCNGKCLFFPKTENISQLKRSFFLRTENIFLLILSCNGKCLPTENVFFLLQRKISGLKLSHKQKCLATEKVFFPRNGNCLHWYCLIKENISQRKMSFFLGTEIIYTDIVSWWKISRNGKGLFS